MSAQQRYRTLVQNIGRIYAAPESERTELLQSALGEIMDVIAPKTQTQWGIVSADSDRLMKVWLAKEKDAAADAVVTQLSDMLRELRALEPMKPEPTPPPVLCMEPVDKIVHVPAAHAVVVVNPEPVPTHPLYAYLQKPAAAKVEEEAEEEEVEEEEEEVEEEEVEAEDQSTEAPEAAEEEVVVEAAEEATEEEEVGLEVEQMTWRGRTYWRDVNTNKIYAVVDEDDVGDEIGELVNGKPAFYAK